MKVSLLLNPEPLVPENIKTNCNFLCRYGPNGQQQRGHRRAWDVAKYRRSRDEYPCVLCELLFHWVVNGSHGLRAEHPSTTCGHACHNPCFSNLFRQEILNRMRTDASANQTHETWTDKWLRAWDGTIAVKCPSCRKEYSIHDVCGEYGMIDIPPVPNSEMLHEELESRATDCAIGPILWSWFKAQPKS